jgi:hypothetical protein
VIATCTALLALLVAGYTAHLQRQQARAAVWPRLQVGRAENRHIIVWNKGTGPARVRRVRVEIDGHRVKDWDELVTRAGQPPKHFSQSQINGSVISAGERINAFSAENSDAG